MHLNDHLTIMLTGIKFMSACKKIVSFYAFLFMSLNFIGCANEEYAQDQSELSVLNVEENLPEGDNSAPGSEVSVVSSGPIVVEGVQPVAAVDVVPAVVPVPAPPVPPVVVPPPPGAPLLPAWSGPVGIHGGSRHHEECIICDEDRECDDKNPCTINQCLQNECVSRPVFGCATCKNDSECDDGDICTTDTCTNEKICNHEPIPGCSFCVTSDQCPSAGPCVEAMCLENQCSYEPIFGCSPCTADVDCQEEPDDPCLTNTCLFVDGPIGFCKATLEPGCASCTTDAECENLASPIDQCVISTCVFIDDAPIGTCVESCAEDCPPCQTDLDCNENNPCSTCNTNTGLCEPIPGCGFCLTPSDCQAFDPCSTCNLMTNTCESQPGCATCEAPEDCAALEDPNNPCVTSDCINGFCVESCVEGCQVCSVDTDCNVDNPCSFCDLNLGTCAPISGCATCTDAAQCPAAPECTTVSCDANVCTYTPIPDCVFLESIDVQPDGRVISQGANLQYQAVGHFSDSSSANITDLVTWSSSDTLVADFVSLTPGEATGFQDGTTTISASLMGVTGSANLTVGSFAFVTSLTMNGDIVSAASTLDPVECNFLVGTEQADCICNSLAAISNNPSIAGGQFFALLSDVSFTALQRFEILGSSGDYYTTGSTFIGEDIANLIINDTNLTSAIFEDESQNIVNGTVWTGALDGGGLGQTCNDWTSSSNLDSGNYGSVTVIDPLWYALSSSSCDDGSSHLYCFQIPPPEL